MADAPAAEPVSIRSRTFAALDNPDYRRYYVGQGISLIGTWVQAAAVSWIVFEKTRSEYVLGLIEAANLMPGLLVGLLAGVLADRVVPRRMILVTQIAQMVLAFVLAGLVGLGVEQVWQMALILALARVFVTFEMPSRQVFLYDLVGRSDLMNAIALNTGLFNASRVIGPALAGVCLVYLGGAGCFALNGLSYFAAIASLLTIRLDERLSPRGARGAGEALGGFAYLGRDRRLAAIYLLMTFFGVVGMGYSAMIPAYARRVIGTDVGGYGVLLACSGVGATCGALAVASLGGLRRKERLVVGGLLLFSASLAAAAFVPPWVTSFRPGAATLAAGSACLFGVGCGAVVFYSAAQTLIQTGVPDELRGRVMGVWMIVYSASVPAGALWTGRAAQAYGVSPVMGASAALCAAVAAAAWGSGRLAAAE